MKKTVLLVDDSKFMRSLLKNIITSNDFEVIAEASNGEEAILQYNMYKPDLVILDITMPKINGLTALKTIKQQYPNSIIIMCSALGQQSLIIEALSAGASDFIVKPFFDNLISVLRKALGP